MKKKIYIVIFIIMFALPPFTYIIFSTGSGNGGQITTTPWPSMDKGVHNYVSGVKMYLTNNVPFKNDIVHMLNETKFKVFGELNTTQAYLGENEWLFYKGDMKNELRTLVGDLKLDELKQESIKNNVVELNNEFKEDKINFGIMICPDKEQVYGDFLLDKYQTKVVNTSNGDFIKQLLSDTDVNYIFPVEELKDYKTNDTYFKNDTHWNSIGGYIGYTSFLESIRKPYQQIEMMNIRKKSRKEDGDLLAMLGISNNVFKNDSDFVLDTNKRTDTKIVKNKLIRNTALEYQEFHSNANGTGTLYIVGDSFAKFFIPYAAEDYEKVVVFHWTDINLVKLDIKPGDTVLVEMVNRRAMYLDITCQDLIKSMKGETK